MEIFKDININTDYQISTYGRIYNKKTTNYLKICYNTNSHSGQTAIRVNGIMKTVYPHRLVAEYFISNDNNFNEVDHIDRNVRNNNITNLRWADRYLQNQNRNNNKNNKSGHRCIAYHKRAKLWCVKKSVNDKTYKKTFKNKIDAICYKYILLLKIKSKVIY
tara:strand:- start:740 stop:1225 length:486 start_codon:yes stop_codon:yes gene_type:complete